MDILSNLKSTIEDYDYIVEANNNSIKFIKTYKTKNIAIVIKLSLENENSGNSILSAVIISMKKINKLLVKNKVIDVRI